MNVGYLSVTVPESLQPALVDESAGAHAFDLFEDRSGTRMKLKPRVPDTAPAQIFLHHFVHCRGITPLKPESDGKSNIATLVENARVISELHVVCADGLAFALLGKQVTRVENVGDKHCTLAFRFGLQEVEILPDSSADSAWDAYIMFEA
jgi:hypothetical protein